MRLGGPDAGWASRGLPETAVSIRLAVRSADQPLDLLDVAMGCGQSTPAQSKLRVFAHEVDGTKTETRGAARSVGSAMDYEPHMTLYTNLMDRKKVDPDGTRPLFGSRKIDPKTGEAGEYEWVTLKDFLPQVDACASGMKTQLHTERGALIGLFSKNRYEWCLVEHACSRMAYTLVPLYDTLGPKAVPFIMNHTEMKVVFCAKAQFKTLMSVVHECPSVKTIVQFEDDVDDEEIALSKEHNVKLLTLAELLKLGKDNIVPADPPKPEDIATICYTSGTTGDPKGVMLTHANFTSEAAGSAVITPVFPSDVHISYLPLAHIYERTIHVIAVRVGASIGFYQGDVAKIVDDLQALKPTLFVTVPRLLNRVHDRITQGVESAPAIKRMLFGQAYEAKKQRLAVGEPHPQHPLWDRLVFDKLKMLMGGRVRLIVNGSAPVTKEVKQFFQIVFSCIVLEGYGLTETTAGICCSTIEMPVGNHVGAPMPGVQISLEDVADMNYSSNDKPRPRGEIVIKGPTIFKGYYKQPELTSQVIDADGWFHTGDIGAWNEDGTLSIIDRKKNIFKLSQGEYVAPEKVEGIYIKSPLVAQAYVHGDSLKNFVVAIITPDPDSVLRWAKENGKPTPESTGKDQAAVLEMLCRDPALNQAVAADLEALGQKFKLFRFERAQKLYLSAEQFSLENGLMTPTFKLKRQQLAQHYSKQIDEMYGIDRAHPPAY